MKFKEPKTIDEQIEYLKSDKRVVYNEISEEDAAKVLEQYGYINVVTPFKYIFAKKEKGTVIKINNKHCYERNIDFNEYYTKYLDERKLYPILFESISSFETTFNAVVSNNIANYYHINSQDAFKAFVQDLKINLLADKYISKTAKTHMNKEIDDLENKLNQYGSIFICLDRLTLNAIITIYKTCNPNLKRTIFDELCDLNNTLGYSDIQTFDDFLIRIVPIRNYVYHNNSLEVLYRYLSINKNTLRTDTDKRKYKNIVKKLIKTKKTTS